LQPFVPLFSNPHLQTLAAHFWPRRLEQRRFPVEAKLYRTQPEVQVLVHTQRPARAALGQAVLVHGLEGSSNSGYMRSMAQAALEAGLKAHRVNLRSCGGTEALSATGYHSGLTGDLRFLLRKLVQEGPAPVFLVGYSLGGNLALKLAGELGEEARPLLAGVCAISTPIDLAACAHRLGAPENWAYEQRFLRSLKRRVRVRQRHWPARFSLDDLDSVRSIVEFDDRITAPAFGFRDAAHYYATQSAAGFLERIRIPGLLIQAKDDPVIPFDIFEQPGISENPNLELLAVEHGGHVGFLARCRPRLWADRVVLEWILGTAAR
jgi:predicted alpha/beta-fold hydrolase